MKGRDFGIGLLVLAIVAATVTAVVVSGRDTSTPASAQDTTHELSTPVSPEGCGEVTAREPGETTVPSPASQWTFPHDAHVQVTAHAHEGCTFSKWVLDFAGYPVEQTTNPSQFQLTEDMTATAHFTGTPASTTPTPTATAVPPPVTASCKWSTLGEDPVLNPGLKSDCETLLKEKSTLAGTATLNWSVDTPMADWDGVELDGTPRRVTSLVLKGKELTGSIPTSFGSLAMLDTLALAQNQLTGAIPVELGNLANLTQLHLEQNQLTGTIPAELGNLTLLTHLVLDNNQLSGDVPWDLAKLTALTHIYLAGNSLTGCVPPAWAGASGNDLTALALPFCMAHDTLDTTGAVETAGSYAFLEEDEEGMKSAVTTYEGLRDGNATLLMIHKTDASGTSQAEFYDAVEADDTFEWYFARDCWVGYRVTEVKADPAGTIPKKLLAVEPYGYAYTGCSGTIPTNAAAREFWRDPLSHGGENLRFPVVYGAFQVVPLGWPKETLFFGEYNTPPADSSDNSVVTRVLSEAQQLPYWRDLPGWTFASAESGTYDAPVYGYCARFFKPSPTRGEGINDRIDVCGTHASGRQTPFWSMDTEDGWVNEVRIINGYPAKVKYYLPTSRLFNRIAQIRVVVYDDSAGSAHYIDGRSTDTLGTNVDAVIEVARSLFVEAGQEEEQMLARAFLFTYDTTGAVTTPGSYSFMSEGDDGTISTVTTYEGLRDGSTTALLIHKTDAEGTSRSDILDAVEAGDLVEWRKADDCFVRYKVLGVKPDPTGTIPKKALDVEWMTYAFTGCSGAISTDTEVGMTWGDMLDLGGVELPAPVVHGPFQIVPAGWTGVVESGEVHELPEGAPEYPGPAVDTNSLAVARGFPYWREPTLPSGWTFSNARTGGYDVSYGYCAIYVSADGYPAVRICGEHAWDSRWAEETSWVAKSGPDEVRQGVLETRLIRGRPALASYSPLGLGHSDSFTVSVRVYDAATESLYNVSGLDPTLLGNNVEGVLAIARSLFEAGQEEEQMLARAFLFTYDTYDTTGAVTTAGSYAFLTEGEDGAKTAVTTYEALRDGTTTMLKIHTSDGDNTSQADVYDDVEEGHLIEWSQAGDCFVRYRVTDAPTLSEGATSREFGVRPETYAWQSCQTGSLPTSGSEDASGTAATAMTITVGTALPLEHLGGTNLTGFAVVHGPWQLTPYVQSQPGAVGSPSAGVTVKPPEYHEPTGQRRSLDEPVHTSDLTQAARLPYWRTPLWLPTGWTFKGAESGNIGGPLYGYCASWINAEGYEAAIICGYYADVRRDRYAATWLTNHDPPRRIVRELREIAGRPAWVDYSPSGSQHHPSGGVEVWIYDTATETVYEIQGADRNLRGANVEAVIRMACSLFWAPSECATP